MALPGVDVSQFQGQPDWNQVAAVNWFAFAKVSEGVGFEDPAWQYNAPHMAATSLIPGAYHFARPDLGNTPEAEADSFWNLFQSRVVSLPKWMLVLDLERGSGNLSSWRDRFCSHLSGLVGHGYVPGWYSYHSFILNQGLNVASPYWLWFAWPDSNGPLPIDLAMPIVFQQYGASPVAGININTDLDRFFTSPDQLRSLTIGGNFNMDYSLKLALVGLMYFAILGRGPKTQTEADQWAAQIGDQGQNAWQVLQTIAASPEAMAYASPATRLKALETAVSALQVAPVGHHTHPFTGVTGQPA